MKEINTEWMATVLKDTAQQTPQVDLPKIDWVQANKAFKRDLKFKLLPANSKENKIWGYTVGTHWSLGPNKDRRFICPEQTAHLAGQHVVCPICEAKRKLMAKGFTKEELSVQGKFGLIPVFEPNITSNVKCVVIDSDQKHDWDKQHVSILQQKGSYLIKWLVQNYTDSEVPDLLEWTRSNIIKFSRPTDTGKWERSIGFSYFEPTPEVIEALKEENEALTLPDLWKMPDDAQIIEATGWANDMIHEYESARATLTEVVEAAVAEDQIPF